MPGSELTPRRGGAADTTPMRTGSYVPPLVAPPPSAHVAPARPTLAQKAAPPVLVKLPPPFTVRVSQLLWILSLLTAAVAVVYAFIIRTEQLKPLEKMIKGVVKGRAAETYTSAAEILYWCVFGGMLLVILLQLVYFVSFMNRKPNVRWWQLATLVLQGIVLALVHEFIALGDRGQPLQLMLLAQLGLAALAFLVSLLPPALHWSARRHDVRRGHEA